MRRLALSTVLASTLWHTLVYMVLLPEQLSHCCRSCLLNTATKADSCFGVYCDVAQRLLARVFSFRHLNLRLPYFPHGK